MIAFENQGLHWMFSVIVEIFTDVDEMTIFNFARKKKSILFQIQMLIAYES
jgi:hypothetical protein